MILGYARVSTIGQALESQLFELEKAGVDRIYQEKATGKTKNRPELISLLDNIRAGDTVVVTRLDRLGRNLTDLIDLTKQINERGGYFRSLGESIDTRGAMGQLLFHIFGALAEFEVSKLRERTMAGLEAAAAEGRFGGRPPKIAGTQLDALIQQYQKGIPAAIIARDFKISMATYYRLVKTANLES
jgi:DNA invertase Pin-like site-specific DNA recombinase